MKKLNTTLAFLLTLFITGLTYAQTCNADATINLTGNPGEVEIIDNSTTSSGGAATYSWVDFYESGTWDYDGSVYVQPYSNTATYQFTQNGSYNYYISVQDSITNCFDSISGTITINNIAVNCDASYSYYDTINNQTYFQPINYDANLEYFWDFGDGNYSNDPYPYHNYNAPGTYTACLIVWDGAGSSNCADTICQTITINSNTTCDASFTFNNIVNNVVDFEADSYNSNLEYHWDFGNGTSTSGANSSHTYLDPGIYNVCLTVWDATGNSNCADTICQTVEIDTNDCIISADYSYSSLGNGVYDFAINNVTPNTIYHWSIESENYSGTNTTHTFQSNGQIYATVIATDTTIPTCQDTVMYPINVTDADSCDFDASFSYSEIGSNQVSFVANNPDPDADYDWNFGDGTHSTDDSTTHTYSNQGTYTVCLTLWDPNGSCADTVCETVVLDSTNNNCNADISINMTGNPGEVEIIDNSTTSSGAAATYSWVEFYTSSPWQYEGTVYIHPYSNTQLFQFAENGTYTYYYSVQDSITNCLDTLMGSFTINNAPTDCDASFTYLDTINGETYFLPDNYDQDLSYYWDFGDGNTSTDPFPTHTYSTPGTYTACLNVWEPMSGGQCADTVCQTVVVTNNNVSCEANFYMFQDSTNMNQYYIWNLSSGSNLYYSWDFGDGTVSNQPYPTHTYTTQGIYTICLSITDNTGNCSDQFCQTFEVLNKAIGTTINVVPFGETADLTEEGNIISDVKLFPNPASSSINITLRGNTNNDYNYQIVDVMGNQIALGELNSNQNVASKEINVEQLQQGVYFVQIIEASNKEKVKTLKFIKK